MFNNKKQIAANWNPTDIDITPMRLYDDENEFMQSIKKRLDIDEYVPAQKVSDEVKDKPFNKEKDLMMKAQAALWNKQYQDEYEKQKAEHETAYADEMQAVELQNGGFYDMLKVCR